MPTKYATFNTADIASNMQYSFYQDGSGPLAYLGAWEYGADMAALPQHSYSEPSTPKNRRDVREANGLIYTAPKTCHDAFLTAREVHVHLLKTEKKLVDDGHSGKALADALTKKLTPALKELSVATAQIVTVRDRLASGKEKLISTFEDAGESEAQQVAFDLALAAKVNEIAKEQATTIKAGMIPPSLNDERIMAAVWRTPHALHGLDSVATAMLRESYFAKSNPLTAQAHTMINDMLESARGALAGAVLTIEAMTHAKAGDVFKLINGGDWLAGASNRVNTR